MKLNPKLRKKSEADVLKIVGEIDSSGLNVGLLKKYFATASDADYMRFIEKGIPIYNPMGGKVDIDHIRNIKIAKRLGVTLEERCWITDPKTGLTQLTRYPHIVLRQSIRRQTQMVDKKLSVAKHSKIKDKLTGQVTGASRAAGVSGPEANVMFSGGYDMSLEEFLHARGGNDKLNRAFYTMLRQGGKGRIKLPGAERTSTKAAKTWGSIWKAMHIGNNIGRGNV